MPMVAVSRLGVWGCAAVVPSAPAVADEQVSEASWWPPPGPDQEGAVPAARSSPAQARQGDERARGARPAAQREATARNLEASREHLEALQETACAAIGAVAHLASVALGCADWPTRVAAAAAQAPDGPPLREPVIAVPDDARVSDEELQEFRAFMRGAAARAAGFPAAAAGVARRDDPPPQTTARGALLARLPEMMRALRAAATRARRDAAERAAQ